MRARGTYATIDNWARKLAPTLPGAAGWVLLELSYQSNYNRPYMRVGDLMNNLPYKVRSIEVALAYLVENGHVESHESGYCLRGLGAKLAQAARKNLRNGQGVEPRQEQEQTVPNPAIETHKKKEEEGREGIEGTEINPKAQESAAPGQASSSQKSVEKTKSQRAGRNSRASSADKVAATPEQREMFGALALVCYGGHDSLTDAAQKRLGNAASSLVRANFTAAEVPLIVLWMQKTEDEKWRSITASNIEDRAPVWRSAQRGSLPVRVAKPSTIKFNPTAKTTEEANDRVRNRARELYNASKETRRAVF